MKKDNLIKLVFSNKKRTVVLDKNITDAYIPRIYHRETKGKQAPCYTIQCGDCDNKIEIYYEMGMDTDDHTTEIGGVLASNKVWKIIFDKILKVHAKVKPEKGKK